MRAGVLIGPSSGSGNAARTLNAIAKALELFDISVCQGLFGSSSAPKTWNRLETKPQENYVSSLRASVMALMDWGIDVLVCVGGDGLASYAADAIISVGSKVPLLGIAAGTINVGPIIAFVPEDLWNIQSIRPEDLLHAGCMLDAIDVRVEGRHLAYGFNDVVFGNTFLGTINGRTVNLSVRALLEENHKQIEIPSTDIVTDSFTICKNGNRIVPEMNKPAQIIASLLREREFYGRAVTGVLCNAPFMEHPAALALSDIVLIQASNPARGLSNFAHVEHLLFTKGDTIELSGFGPHGQIIVDGNPFMRNGYMVSLVVCPRIVQAIHPESIQRG